jgi:hypothetical protein
MKPKMARTKKIGENTQRSQNWGMRKLNIAPRNMKLVKIQRTEALNHAGRNLMITPTRAALVI